MHTCTQGYSSRLFSQYSDGALLCHLHHSVETTDCSRVKSFCLEHDQETLLDFLGMLLGEIFHTSSALRVVLN